MKYVNCPTCEWTLGVPGKLLGHPVSCPKCDKSFIAEEDLASEDKPAKKKRTKDERKSRSSRALPTPAVAPSQSSTDLSSVSDFDPPRKTGRDVEPPSPPIRNKSRLRSPHRDRLKPAANTNETEDSTPSRSSSSEPSSQVVAKIIHAEPVEEDLVKDGSLPTLQLKDDVKKKVDKGELKSRPVFLGLVICASVLSSGLMLFLADFSPQVDEKALEKARQEIRRYYSVRTDVQLKPFQLELREAQLAHSRNDREAEIAAYRKVMARFRAEDKNKNGITGSPSADIELKKWVSILLGDGNSGSIP